MDRPHGKFELPENSKLGQHSADKSQQPVLRSGVYIGVGLRLSYQLDLKTLLACFTLLAVAIITTAVVLPTREPQHQGYILSAWVSTLSDRNLQEFGPGCTYQNAPRAIRAIGTNGLSYLVNWVGYSGGNTPIRNIVLKAMDWFPSLQNRKTLLNWAWFDTKDVRGEGAYISFSALGPIAAPAIPGLTRVAMRQGEIIPRYRAVYALRGIGAQALPALLLIATNRVAESRLARIDEGGVRNQAAVAIGMFGPDARPAVPHLVKLLADDDQEVAAGAAEALGAIPLDAEQVSNVVPALAKACLGPGNRRQQTAIKSLTDIGAAARQAIPTLQMVGHGRFGSADSLITACAAAAVARIEASITDNTGQ